MFLIAAALTASISIDLDLTKLLRKSQVQEPSGITCNIKTVGYRFVGTPGRKFAYAGDTWTIPAEGSIELIADRRRTTYAIEGKSLPLDGSPRDQFGFREVALPPAESLQKGGSR